MTALERDGWARAPLRLGNPTFSHPDVTTETDARHLQGLGLVVDRLVFDSDAGGDWNALT